ncbi:MAG: hypothetical protein QW327_05070, partial [Candidatus Odinarchaeota archaeon]
VIIGGVSAYAATVDKASSKLRNTSMIVYSSLVSVFLSLILPTLILIFIMVGLSLYDIYSVIKGPIKKTIQVAERKGGLSVKLYVNIGSWEIGIGDLVFYSILVAHTLLFYGLLVWLLSILSLITGLAITFLVLVKREIMPGLPIALFIGMIPLLIAYFII